MKPFDGPEAWPPTTPYSHASLTDRVSGPTARELHSTLRPLCSFFTPEATN